MYGKGGNFVMGMTSYESLADKVVSYLDSGDWETPYNLLKEGTDNGDAVSTCLLGEMYFNGIGVLKDVEYAMNLYEKATSLGCAEAACHLGDAYSHGVEDIVPEDMSKAFQYSKRAAELGSAHGLGVVAGCYLWGDGTAQNNELAFEYALKGAKLGDAWAMTIVGICYSDGIATQKDPYSAAHWFRESLYREKDRSQNMYNLAVCLADPFEDFGISPSLDMYEEAYSWTCKAVELGNVDAHIMAAWFYETGTVVPQDYSTAHHYLELAANNGNELANNLLKRYRRNIYGDWCI